MKPIKRSAICISGLARSYRKTVKAFCDNLWAPLAAQGEVDVFVSIWDSNGVCGQQCPVDLDEIMDLYSPAALDVESYAALKPGMSLKRFTERECPVPSIMHDGVLMSVPTQYKVLRCNNLKRTAEMIGCFRYDLVVRTRFDLEMSPLRMAEVDATKVGVMYHHDELVGDYFYIAGSAQMDSLVDVFNNYPYLLNLPDTDMGPERNLCNHARQRELGVYVLKDHPYAIVRPASRDQFRWDAEGQDYRPQKMRTYPSNTVNMTPRVVTEAAAVESPMAWRDYPSNDHR